MRRISVEASNLLPVHEKERVVDSHLKLLEPTLTQTMSLHHQAEAAATQVFLLYHLLALCNPRTVLRLYILMLPLQHQQLLLQLAQDWEHEHPQFVPGLVHLQHSPLLPLRRLLFHHQLLRLQDQNMPK